MESFRFLALLSLMAGFCLGKTNGQVSPKMRYNLLNECATKSLSNRDVSLSQKNGLCLYRMKALPFPWRDITESPNSIFLSSNRNLYEFVDMSIFLSDNNISLTGKSLSITSSSNVGTFSGKWERLTGKPIIETSRVYYSPLKRTNNPTFYDSQFYRTGATIYNMLVILQYPYLSRSK